MTEYSIDGLRAQLRSGANDGQERDNNLDLMDSLKAYSDSRGSSWQAVGNTLSAQAVSPTTWTQLDNNGLGAYSDSSLRDGVSQLWDGNHIDLSEVAYKALVRVRIDVAVTTTSNSDSFQFRLAFYDSGDSLVFSLPIGSEVQYRTSGTRQMAPELELYVGPGVRDVGPPVENYRIEVETYLDGNPGTCLVNGWLVVAETV